jgi:hypothetical protein
MSRRLTVLAALMVVAAGCSSLGEPGVPIAIEVTTPTLAAVDIDDTITLRARLVDQAGDSIGGEIRWRTPDTTIGVDSTTGAIWGIFTGTGRVQAVSGSVVSPLISFSVRAVADTIIVDAAAESLFVLVTDTASTPLGAKIAQANGTGLQGRTIIFTLVTPTESGVRLTGDVLGDTLTTGSNGLSSPVIRVRDVGTSPGDSAFVEVQGRRPSGKVIPGSGQVIRVYFE